MPLKPGKAPEVNWLNSNQQTLYHDLDYSEEDINASRLYYRSEQSMHR